MAVADGAAETGAAETGGAPDTGGAGRAQPAASPRAAASTVRRPTMPPLLTVRHRPS
ncbi:hypothetical protein KCH_08620 [Kitasatospora cheerisanensis KCTC 2395]|uniref:Uncharacterized protein n=1 Tax=Kitasatospora cheerisanensis KCTC 2395 TaxID=1348663 RepID=A0A066ZAN1_9ACTN|nr:hypothetical protein KCH_08620 [Kitasatospora cheerisanensis KCTC 2395]